LNIRRAVFWVVSLAGLTAGCTLGGPAPTPTLSANDVLNTAQAIAEQTRQAGTPTPLPATATPPPTVPAESPTPLPSATPSAPSVTADYNANVRSGPGAAYPVIDFLLEGETATVLGRFDDPDTGTWWSIHRLAQGLDGWVWTGAVTFGGDPSLVPYLEPPPTPEPTES
jgi:hypothetical protein